MNASQSQVNSNPADLGSAYAAFVQAYPAYASTPGLDELRARDYARLDAAGHIYLDYTGGGLYAESQLRQHLELLSRHVFGNPHSNNPTSLAMTHLVEQARAYVLEYFNASPDDYLAIFTSNASGALKLVGEAYPFAPGGQYLLSYDNHNSVNGIRQYALAHGAAVTYAPMVRPELRLDETRLQACLERARPGAANLFAYPAQSNFSGAQHPLEWIARARACGWDVLVDCAAFAPSNRLDMSRWQPDFVPLSFYKMFGYPTGVGCLLARKSAVARLKRPWFAGGTIKIASVQAMGHYLIESEAGFEDGTVNYLNLPAVEIGLRHLASVDIDAIHTRVMVLTGWLLDQLLALRHANDRRLLDLYGPADTHMRGGTLAVNFYDVNGQQFDARRIEELANQVNISLRTGCFCNPGAGESAHGLNKAVMDSFFQSEQGLSFQELRAAMRARYNTDVGAVRISVGIASNFADVYRFVRFASSLLNKTVEDVGPAQGALETCGVLRDVS